MPPRNPLCKTRNGYYNRGEDCDSYTECRDYQAKEMQCPDGLHFDPKAVFPNYPCGYPMDVSCEGRGPPQPARSTSECPHQYGFFPSAQAKVEQCGAYRMCVEGHAIEMTCPVGLAFNPEISRCDWPDLVPSCNADAYLGFKCPVAPLDKDGKLLIVNYKYESNCYAFFSCEEGHARLLMCDAGFAFDPEAGRCVDADLVKC
ncbi:unnamed protein product [Chilo suppressalis]|uniref:Chitin-binding type-2 domain-containing protein n=1 Tax=Chilo suppressalis TaxID=168631 RepID=A0ABN8BFJ1_CHISP|nr:unnamed protein product [Chilo suppressalis]